MKNSRVVLALALATAALLAACNPFLPPKSCYFKHTRWGVRTDTVYNQVKQSSLPDSLKSSWVPYVLMTHLEAIDSVRLCD